MFCRTHALVAGLCLTLVPFASTAEENYGAILQKLPGPVPVVTSPSCLTGGTDAEAGADPAFLAEYTRPFDEDAGKAVLAYLESAIAAAPGSAVAPPGPDDFEGQTATQAFTQAYSSLGLDPANVLDVATLYLSVAWAAQKGEISALMSLDANRLAAVKAQLVGGELRCAFLNGVKDDLAAQRNQMIALTGILIDGMESHSRSDTLDALAADARKVFADQTDGLHLTERGFVSP
jgi:hypothetical protein